MIGLLLFNSCSQFFLRKSNGIFLRYVKSIIGVHTKDTFDEKLHSDIYYKYYKYYIIKVDIYAKYNLKNFY